MLRWSLMLGAYQYDIKFREGKNHQNADALSRLPIDHGTFQVPEIPEILYCGEGESQFLVTFREIAEHTRRDPVLSQVLKHIQEKYSNFPDNSERFKPYSSRINELSANNKCVLWGARVIIPEKLRPRLLEMLHEVHQGMTAMKAIARSYFWWPGLDEDIEMTARQCMKCAQNSKHPPATAAKPWPTTSKPCSRLHIDYAGPFMDTNFLIIVDSFSKWVDVKITKNTSSSTTIELLRDVFATHGLPDTIVSDNGRNFVSDEFKSFLKANGIIHICTAPYHPSSNGQAERFVQTVKNHLKKMPPSNMKKNVANLLLRLRTTPTVNSNQSPAEILMGRRLKTVFSHVYPDIKPNQEQVEPDKPVRSFKAGDDVWYRNFGKGERWYQEPFKQQVPEITKSVGMVRYRRDISTSYEIVFQAQIHPSETKPHYDHYCLLRRLNNMS